MEDIAKYFGFQVTRSKNSISLVNAHNQIHFPINNRKAYVNSIKTHLSFAPKLKKNSVYLSEQDFSLLIDPIVRKESLPPNDIRRIVLDPGHGGKDKGATGTRAFEKDLNLKLAKELKSILSQKGYQVLLTRENDKYISLGERSKIAKNWSADLFISIHCNAAASKSVTGIETFLITPKGSPSTSQTRIQAKKYPGNKFDKLNAKLAYEVHKKLISSTGSKDRGIKYYRWQVLREASCPAILVETGFLSNLGEERKLADPKYQKKIVLALAKGITGFQRALQSRK